MSDRSAWSTTPREGDPSEWGTLRPAEVIRIQARYPQATRESIREAIDPWLKMATPDEAWVLWNLIDDSLAARDGQSDGPQERYRRARVAVESEGNKPTDTRVAEKLGITDRTIRQWRKDGLIGRSGE